MIICDFFCLKRSPLKFTFILALLYTSRPSDMVRELIFSLYNPFDSHEKNSLPTVSKYLYTG